MSALFTRAIAHLPVGVPTPTVSPQTAIAVDDTAYEDSKLDVPAGYDPGTDPAIDVPFGTINVAAKGVLLYNALSQDLVITINGVASLFRLSAGGVIKLACPTDPVTGRFTSMSFKTAGVQATLGYVFARLFGE